MKKSNLKVLSGRVSKVLCDVHVGISQSRSSRLSDSICRKTHRSYLDIWKGFFNSDKLGGS